MQRKIFVVNSKDQVSGNHMLGISETNYIVNEIIFSIVMTTFEIPISPFRSSIDEVRDDCFQWASIYHGLAVTLSLPQCFPRATDSRDRHRQVYRCTAKKCPGGLRSSVVGESWLLEDPLNGS